MAFCGHDKETRHGTLGGTRSVWMVSLINKLELGWAEPGDSEWGRDIGGDH